MKKILLFIFTSFLLFFQNALAQTPRFEANTEQDFVVQGSFFEVQFELTNGQGGNFRPPSFDGFRVMAGPNTSSSVTIVNGRYSQSMAWGFTLQAVKTGKFTIGAASVKVGSQTLQTKPFEIEVAAAKHGSPGGGVGQSRINTPPSSAAEEDLFVSAQLSTQTAWLSQQVVLNYVVYTRTNIQGYDVRQAPSFEGFFAKEMNRFDTRPRQEQVGNKTYTTRILQSIALFPQQTGELTIDPMQFTFLVERPNARNSPFGGLLSGGTPVQVSSEALKLTVKPLPEPAPENFCGVVGQYQWEVRADKKTLSTDDALAVQISLRGNGDGKRFINPKFRLPAELEAYDPTTKEEETYESGEELIHARSLEYSILPKQAGEFEIWPELVYFDPDSARYVTKRGPQAIKISVSQGTQSGKAAWRPDAGTIAEIRDLPGFSRGNTLFFYSPQFWFLLFAPVLGLLGWFFWEKRRAEQTAARAASPILQQKMKTDAARERLAHARAYAQTGDAKAFYDEVARAMFGYVAAKTGQPAADLTKNKVRDLLAEHLISAQLIDNVSVVLQACEMALFAGQTQTADMNRICQLAEDTIRGMETEMSISRNVQS